MFYKKCINYVTGKDCKEHFLTFSFIEQKRSNVLASARSQPFCRKYNINIGYFNGKEVWPTHIPERNIALKIHNNHFCLIRKSNNIIFNKAIENELNPNFKVVDNVISDKHVKSFIKYEYKPKQVQSQITNMVVYDTETFNNLKCVPYPNCIHKLRKISGEYNRVISEKEND